MRLSENPTAIPRLAIPPQRQRRHRRFNLQFPVSLSFSSHEGVRELDAVSANISIGGVLLEANDAVPPHTQVSLVMEVKGPWSHRPVRLVVKDERRRVVALAANEEFHIASVCQHPIS